MWMKPLRLNWKIKIARVLYSAKRQFGEFDMKMTRGKQQILFNYLPGKTFDFDKSNRLAQITSIRGIQKNDMNVNLVLQAIEQYTSAWGKKFSKYFL